MASSDGRKKSGILSWVGRKLSRDEGEDGLGEGGEINTGELQLKKENNEGKDKKDVSKRKKDEEGNANDVARERMKDWEQRMASIDGRNKSGIQPCVTKKLSREEGEDERGEGGKTAEEKGELASEEGQENSNEKDSSEGQKEEKGKNTEAGEKPEDSEERMVSSNGRKMSGVLSWMGRKLSREEGEDGLGEGGKKNPGGKGKKEEEAKATGASGKSEDGEERMMSSNGRKKSGILSWVGRKLSRDDGEDKGKEEEVKTIGAGRKQDEQRVWRGGPRGATEVTMELQPELEPK